MDYAAIYDRLISRARNRVIEGYTERHHVLPRCMGGGDDSENIVRLTAEEHFVAHELLAKMYPGNGKLAYSLLALTMNCGGNRPNNKSFGWVRRLIAKAIADGKRGVPRDPEMMARLAERTRGIVRSKETLQRMSAARKGRPHTPEHNAKVGRKGRKSPMEGRKHSEETKRKMREAATGRKMSEDAVRKAVESKTPEQRRQAALKAWETKRAKKAAQQSET